ncbi:hypothetical protein D3C81_1948390 [compost metagenome]
MLATNHSFQCPTAVNSDSVAITGPDNGNTMRNRVPQFPQPSILADSSNPCGSPWKKVRKMIMFHTPISEGII